VCSHKVDLTMAGDERGARGIFPSSCWSERRPILQPSGLGEGDVVGFRGLQIKARRWRRYTPDMLNHEVDAGCRRSAGMERGGGRRTAQGELDVGARCTMHAAFSRSDELHHTSALVRPDELRHAHPPVVGARSTGACDVRAYRGSGCNSVCRGSLPLVVNLYRSCIGLGWLPQETTGLDWFGPPRSNTLRPVSSCRVLELGVFVIGVTNWSGEGVRPKSLEVVFDL
jgi:hypothetical protein